MKSDKTKNKHKDMICNKIETSRSDAMKRLRKRATIQKENTKLKRIGRLISKNKNITYLQRIQCNAIQKLEVTTAIHKIKRNNSYTKNYKCINEIMRLSFFIHSVIPITGTFVLRDMLFNIDILLVYIYGTLNVHLTP